MDIELRDTISNGYRTEGYDIELRDTISNWYRIDIKLRDMISNGYRTEGYNIELILNQYRTEGYDIESISNWGIRYQIQQGVNPTIGSYTASEVTIRSQGRYENLNIFLYILISSNLLQHQGCQMVCFQTKNPNLGKFWRVLQWKILVYFMTIWSILRPYI
jgi:hypothetical protein